MRRARVCNSVTSGVRYNVATVLSMSSALLQSVRPSVLLICAVIFLLALVFGARLIIPHNQLPGRQNAPLPMPEIGKAPVFQLELARNEYDLRALLMTGDIHRNLADARAGNRLDSWLFIPAYAGLLLTSGIWLASRNARLSPAILALTLVVIPVIAACDWLENAGITRAIDHIESDGQPQAGDANRISTPSIIKWTLLTIVLAGYGLIAVRPGRWWEVVIGVAFLLSSVVLAIPLGRYFVLRFF